MSRHGGPQQLTLDDLERFLAEPIETGIAPDEEVAAVAADWDPTPYFEAAAVLVAFDPFDWQPEFNVLNRQESEAHEFDSDLDDLGREALLDRLLPLCDQIVDGPLRGLWSLSFAERRAWLRRLAKRERMRSALDATSNRPDTPTQHMLEHVIDDLPLVLDELSRDELAALITVLDWTSGILDGLPDRSEVMSTLARADLLAPMRRLVQHGFVNREEELAHLAQYVDDPDDYPPLFVFGSGGVGKSTLLAQFILEHVDIIGAPFAYINIDRPTLRPDEPLTILIEIIAQLQQQLSFDLSVTESLVNEIVSDISRQESERYQESVSFRKGSDHYIEGLVEELYHALSRDERTNDKAIIFLDTFEEAQWFGLEVVDELLNFLFDLNAYVNFKLIISGRVLPPEFVYRTFPGVLEMPGEADLEIEKLLKRIPLPKRPVNVNVLDERASRDLLRNAVEEAGLAPLNDEELDDIISIVSRNPMCLKLAVRLLDAVGIEKLREARSEFLVQLKAEKIQALLYGRILHHIHNDDVRRVAYPGLVVRRITPKVIRDVLAEPCGLELTEERDEDDIFGDLAREVALVKPDHSDGSLRHRVDVRRAMLGDLMDHVKKEIVEQIDRAAVSFYAKEPDAAARAEEIYHRLRLGEPFETLDARWMPEAAIYLKDAGEELPAKQQLWLAEKLGITLDDSVREVAGQEDWEDQAARSADRYLQKGKAEMALKVLHEREERLPRSALYSLEAEAYRILGVYDDEALRVGRQGVEALSKAGAIDMTLDLLLKMAVIEEGRGNVEATGQLLDEANAVVVHSNNEIKRLRVQITRLRIQRKFEPDAHGEQATLRREALDSLSEDMTKKLRRHPVLLRETAAELGAMSPMVTREAINTLGLEVATDDQAKALGRTISTLFKAPYSVYQDDPDFVSFVKQLEITDFDADVIRKWVMRRGRKITKSLGRSAGESAPESDVLRDFQTYFRAGVERSLRGLDLDPD